MFLQRVSFLEERTISQYFSTDTAGGLGKGRPGLRTEWGSGEGKEREEKGREEKRREGERRGEAREAERARPCSPPGGRQGAGEPRDAAGRRGAAAGCPAGPCRAGRPLLAVCCGLPPAGVTFLTRLR